jgi:hypothetical protein
MCHKATPETAIHRPAAFAQSKPSMELKLERREGMPDIGCASESYGPMK